MDPRYNGAPEWDQGQYNSDASKRGPQLPTSHARPSAHAGPPAPPHTYGPPSQASYGPPSNSSQPGYGPSYSPGQPRGAVPAYPSGQYPAAHQQQGQGAHAPPGYAGYAGQPGSTPHSGPASPSRMSFAPQPGVPQQYAPQQYGHQQYAQQQYAQQQQQQQQQQYGQPPFGQQPGAPGPSMASLMNPWNMITSVSQMGNNMQASQQYVSSRVSWFTGGFFGNLFQIDPEYVRRKLVLLLAPFLHRYDYMRQAENMATPMPTMKPPREDLFAPDLYIPLHAVFTYVVLSACNRFIGGSFKPDVMYNMFTWASMCWALNFGLMFVLIRLMQLHAPPPALEIFAIAGYSFVGYCVSIVFGWALGRNIGWYTAWLYTSCCMAIYLIRTFKQVIRIDAANRGRSVLYLLLAIGAAQFVVSWVMGATVHSPAVAKQVVDSTLPGT